jgi:threonine/homoserine/homoserine lactone efflux protein
VHAAFFDLRDCPADSGKQNLDGNIFPDQRNHHRIFNRRARRADRVLCIRRTLADGRVSGLVSQARGRCGDAVLRLHRRFRLTFVSGFLIGGQAWLRIVGGVFLCFLGIRTLLSGPAEKAALRRGSLAGAFVSTFFLTLTNPMTILSFMGIFAGLGDRRSRRGLWGGGRSGSWAFSARSALWWLLLAAASVHCGEGHSRGMQWVNRGAGAIIAAFGVLALLA